MRGGARKDWVVFGDVPGRGLVSNPCLAGSPQEAERQFYRHFGGAALVHEVVPAKDVRMSGLDLGLHTRTEQKDALQMAERAYFEALRALDRGFVRVPTENLGYLKAVAALAYAEGEEDLAESVNAMRSDLEPRLADAWRGV